MFRTASLRGYLVLLVLSVLLPGLVFAGVLFARYYDSEVNRLDQDLLGDARQRVLTVDVDLSGLRSTLETLAASRALDSGDMAGFYGQAEKLRTVTGVDVLLRDLRGQQLINTRQPFGTALPLEPLPDDAEAIATRRSIVSGVLTGAVAKKPVFTITTPVVRDDRVLYLLNFSLDPRRLSALLADGLEPGRWAGVVDRKGLILAHSERFEQAVGQPASSDFVAKTVDSFGTWRGTNALGQKLRTAYARSALSGWRIYVSTPDDALLDSLRGALLALSGLGLALLLLASAAAFFVAGGLARSMRGLTEKAARLGRGEPLQEREFAVREIDEVAHAMVDASRRLREREEARDQAVEELRQLSESLEHTVGERTKALLSEMERREASEAALRQVQKMEAIGQLTGGIAHDFNNMLAVVMGSLDLARRRLARGETDIGRYVTNALEGAGRAAALTQRLLAFARQQPLAPQPLDVNKRVSDMSEFLRRSLGETIALETVLAGGLWRVYADPNQLESAILNLAVNARDAMLEGGKLTVETANAFLDEVYAARETMAFGQYVMIAVTDTGTGMSPDVAARAFDPFFTTKRSGDGTGLGLSQVYGFVKQSGGHVKIYSEPGHGTTVKVYLPRYLGEDKPPADPDPRRIATGEGVLAVLVVEDDAAVRRQSVEALNELGFVVREAESGAAALALLDAGEHVDLLFTDVVMPDMNGKRLADAAQARRPNLKVLFTTGYTRNAIVHNAMLDPGVNLIGKPFTVDQLGQKLAEVLGR